MRLAAFPLFLLAVPLAALDWSTHGPLAGSVTQIAISPAAPRVIYAGNGAGVFRSDDAGDTWRDVSGPLHSVEHLAVDPTNADVVFATFGTNLYKTTNGGATWRNVESSIRPSALLIDPLHPSTIYLGSRCGPIGFSVAPAPLMSGNPFADAGVYKSTDGGETWTAMVNGLVGRFFSVCIDELSLDPATPQHLFTSPIYSDGGYSESYDSGATWTRADTTVPGLAVVADATYVLTRYGLTNHVSIVGPFMRTRDGGLTWSFVKTSGLPLAGYVYDLAQDPATGRLFLGADNGLFRSGDGGTTWADAGAPAAPTRRVIVDRDAGFVYAAAATGLSRAPLPLGPWQPLTLNDASTNVTNVIADPRRPARLYAAVFDYANTGRIFMSDDGGGSWQLLRQGRNFGYASVAVDAAGDLYVNGPDLSRYSPATGQWTTHTKPPSSFNLVADPTRPGVLWSFASPSSTLAVSTDGGDTWTSHPTPFFWVQSLVADAKHPSTIYAAGNGGFARSTDDGATWTLLSNSSTESLAMSPASGTRLYKTAYTQIKFSQVIGLYRSDDAGASWTAIDNLPNEPAGVGAMAVDVHDPDSLWVVANSRVLHTPDGGATWQDAGVPVDAIGIAVASDGSRIHVATRDRGVWDAPVPQSRRRVTR